MIDSEAGLESSRWKKERCSIESIFTRDTIMAPVTILSLLSARGNLIVFSLVNLWNV